MIILKKNNDIDETKLDRNESILFVNMLRCELERHLNEKMIAKERACYPFSCNIALVKTFWNCQKENHKIDVEKIEKCIDYLTKKWGIKK